MIQVSFHIALRMRCQFAFALEVFDFEFCYSKKSQAMNVLGFVIIPSYNMHIILRYICKQAQEYCTVVYVL